MTARERYDFLTGTFLIFTGAAAFLAGSYYLFGPWTTACFGGAMCMWLGFKVLP